MSIKDDALDKVSQKARKKEEADTKRTQKIRNTHKQVDTQFLASISKMPVVAELICDRYKVPFSEEKLPNLSSAIMKWSSGICYLNKNIGHVFRPLIQKIDFDKDNSAPDLISLCAWAVRFINVFGVDIYFIPYKNPARGFAITVIDSNGHKHYFKGDISRKDAVNWYASYLEKN